MDIYKIYSYPKFGDHCVCYGIIKELNEIYDKVEYHSDVMDDNTFNTNKRLYANLKNVELIREPIMSSGIIADHCIANTKFWFDTVNPWKENPYLPTPEWFNESWIFDRQWYMNANIPFKLKWDNFNFERDLNKEKEVFYDILGLNDKEPFIFLHEDPLRDFFIKREYINPDIKLIEFSKNLDINILDILYTVEKAKEVHTFNTGTLSFIDLMNINHNNLYYHKYIRPFIFDYVALRLNWNTIN